VNGTADSRSGDQFPGQQHPNVTLLIGTGHLVGRTLGRAAIRRHGEREAQRSAVWICLQRWRRVVLTWLAAGARRRFDFEMVLCWLGYFCLAGVSSVRIAADHR
jgi:hypothetical protein